MNSRNKTNQVQADVSATHADNLKCSSAPDHINRLARAIAKGGAPMPDDVDLATKAELLKKVNQIRRTRFIDYISGVIAKNIFEARQKT